MATTRSALTNEDLSTFVSLPWYNSISTDPTFIEVSLRVLSPDPSSHSDSFFASTLFTSTTIRACQAFYRGPLSPSRWPFDRLPTPEQQAGPGEARVIFSLGAGGLDGHAGYAHGGLAATLLDEVMGVPLNLQTPQVNVTKELSLEYKKAIATPGVVLARCWVEKEEGRRVWVRGHLEDGDGGILVTGRGIMVKLKGKL